MLLWTHRKAITKYKTLLNTNTSYKDSRYKNGGMIKVLIENEQGYRVSIPYCPKGYPMCIFVGGKSKTAFNKALVKANNLASINN